MAINKMLQYITERPWLKTIITIFYTLFIWFLGQIYTQQVDYLAKQSDLRIKDYCELLDIGSKIVTEIYPPGLRQSSDQSRVPPQLAQKLLKDFEVLYWGRSGMVVNDKVETSLKDLRLALLDICSGYDPSTDLDTSRCLLQEKLYLLSKELRKDHEKTATIWFPYIHFADLVH